MATPTLESLKLDPREYFLDDQPGITPRIVRHSDGQPVAALVDGKPVPWDKHHVVRAAPQGLAAQEGKFHLGATVGEPPA